MFSGILAAPQVFCVSIPEDKIPATAKFPFFIKLCGKPQTLRSVVSLRHNIAFTKLLKKGIQKFDFFYSSFKVLKSKTFFWPGYLPEICRLNEKAIHLIEYFVWKLLGGIISRTSVMLLHQHHFNRKKINHKKNKCSLYIEDIQGYLLLFCNYLSRQSLLTVICIFFLISFNILFI